MMLADLGASVVKVEPLEGEAFRELPGFYAWNRGKRSIAVNLKSGDGITVVERVQNEQDFAMQTHQNCMAIENLKAAITEVLEDGRDRVIARRADLDNASFQESMRYYDRQLRRFQPRRCE